MKKGKVLFIATSHNTLGHSGRPTGLWLDELATPYEMLVEKGYEITVASPQGGEIPVDPESLKDVNLNENTHKFSELHASCLKDSKRLSEIDVSLFDAVFYPGGHGPMWDLATDKTNAELLTSAFALGKIVGAVCHGPAALLSARGENGKCLIANKNVTGFSDAEETLVHLDEVVPFMLEDVLGVEGGIYSSAPAWQSHVVRDGHLITGQNPQSASETAAALIAALEEK